MAPRKKRLLQFVVLPAAVVVIVIVVLAMFGASPRATTPDGKKIIVEKVTFGTHHRFIQGKWWVRLLRPIRGKAWAARRGCYEMRFTNDTPALMVWTRWEGLHRLNASSLGVQATLVDEQGTESELVLNRWNALPGSFSGDPGPQYGYIAWLFNNFPRHSKTVRLRIYGRGKPYPATEVIEIALANSWRKRFLDWSGSQLPVAIATKGMEFVLSKVEQTSNALWRLSFDVRTNGVIDPSWLVGGVTASSGSGNFLVTRSNLPAAGTTNITFQLRGTLWPEEPVWRFGAEFVRTAGFQPGELWTVTNVAIPTRNMPFQFTTNLAGQPLSFKMESIPRNPPSTYRPHGIWRNANVYVQFQAPDRHVLLVEAADDQGRRIESEVDPGAPRIIYLFGLAIPEGARTVNLKFAVRKFVPIDFDVLSTSFSRTNAAMGIDRSRN